MEERQVTGQHRLTIDNRKSGTFTGILDIVSFDPNELLLQTELGMLHVKGKGLHVSRLDLAKKEVEMQGEVEAFHYSGSAPKKAAGSLLTRVFGS